MGKKYKKVMSIPQHHARGWGRQGLAGGWGHGAAVQLMKGEQWSQHANEGTHAGVRVSPCTVSAPEGLSNSLMISA